MKQNPIFYAVLNNNIDIVEILKINKCNIYQEDINKNSIVHLAAKQNNFNMIKYLIEIGCNFQYCNSEIFFLPLIFISFDDKL